MTTPFPTPADSAMSSSIARKSLLRAGRDVAHEYFRRGPLGPTRLVAKALLLCVRYPVHRRWTRVIGGPTTRAILAIEPRTAYRHSSSYLFAGLAWRQRVHLMSAHYAFLNARHDAAFFNEVIGPRGLPLWRLSTAASSPSITLHGPAHHREGDLSLHFAFDGATIFRLGFSVLPADFFAGHDAGTDRMGVNILYIGQVQGVAGEVERLRHATRQCAGIAPQDLLMSALAGIADAWSVDRCLTSGADRHLSAAKLSATATPFDYAAFWERYHAAPIDDGQLAIDVPYFQKPILQIVTRHRKRTLVKREFKRLLVLSVAANLAPRPTAAASDDGPRTKASGGARGRPDPASAGFPGRP